MTLHPLHSIFYVPPLLWNSPSNRFLRKQKKVVRSAHNSLLSCYFRFPVPVGKSQNFRRNRNSAGIPIIVPGSGPERRSVKNRNPEPETGIRVSSCTYCIHFVLTMVPIYRMCGGIQNVTEPNYIRQEF